MKHQGWNVCLHYCLFPCTKVFIVLCSCFAGPELKFEEENNTTGVRVFKVVLLPKVDHLILNIVWVATQNRCPSKTIAYSRVAENSTWLYVFEAPSCSERYEARFKVKGIDKDLTQTGESRVMMQSQVRQNDANLKCVAFFGKSTKTASWCRSQAKPVKLEHASSTCQPKLHWEHHFTAKW